MINFNKYKTKRVWYPYNYRCNQGELKLFGGFEVYEDKKGSLYFKERDKHLNNPKVMKSDDLKKSSVDIRFLWFLTREELRLFMEERKKDFYSPSKIKEMTKKRKIQRLNRENIPGNVVLIAGIEGDD